MNLEEEEQIELSSQEKQELERLERTINRRDTSNLFSAVPRSLNPSSSSSTSTSTAPSSPAALVIQTPIPLIDPSDLAHDAERAEAERLRRTIGRRETGRLGRVKLLPASPELESRAHALQRSRDDPALCARRATQADWRERHQLLASESAAARDRFIAERRLLREQRSRDEPPPSASPDGPDQAQMLEREQRRLQRMLAGSPAPQTPPQGKRGGDIYARLLAAHPLSPPSPAPASSLPPHTVHYPPASTHTLTESPLASPASPASDASPRGRHTPVRRSLFSPESPSLLRVTFLQPPPTSPVTPLLLTGSSDGFVPSDSPSDAASSPNPSPRPSPTTAVALTASGLEGRSADGSRGSSGYRSLGSISEVKAGLAKLLEVETRLGSEDRIGNLNLMISRVDQIAQEAQHPPSQLILSVPEFHLQETPLGTAYPAPEETVLPSGASASLPKVAALVPRAVLDEDEDNSFDTSGSEPSEVEAYSDLGDSSTSDSGDSEIEEAPAAPITSSLDSGISSDFNAGGLAAPLTPQRAPTARAHQKTFKLFASPQRPSGSVDADPAATPALSDAADQSQHLMTGQVPEAEVAAYFNILRTDTPGEFQRRKADRKKRKLAALAVTVCTFGVALPFYVKVRRQTKRESESEKKPIQKEE